MHTNQEQNTSEQTFIAVLMAICILFLLIGVFYGKHKHAINSCFVTYISAQLSVIEPISERSARIKANLNNTDPETITFEQFWALASYAGRWLRWAVFPLSLYFAYLVYFPMGRIEQFKRRFDMNMLLKNNVKLFPELAPIVNRKKPITEEPMDHGPWRTARSPLQFALENGLIIDQDGKPVPWDKMMGDDGLPRQEATTLRLDQGMFLDLDRTEAVFASQLGDTFSGVENLKTHQKALASALLAYGHSDRHAGIEHFNQLSLSFKEKEQPLDISGTDELLQSYRINHKQLVQHAEYTNCWLSALLEFARGKGVIACSMFIWLRPTDRTLWYALNQCGRRVAWPEAAGVRAHMQAEARQGRAIKTPRVESAVIALENTLIKSGYLFASPKNNMEEDIQEEGEYETESA